MSKQSTSLRRLAEAGLIAAMYAALSLVLPVASFGVVQCRLSEALTILAVFTPAAIPGLTIGCAITNLAGLGMGANSAGAWDILWGSFATFAAAWLTWWLRRIRVKGLPVLSTLPPVLINAVVVGTELTLLSPQVTAAVWGIQMASVALGQAAACIAGGLILYTALDRTGTAARLFGEKK